MYSHENCHLREPLERFVFLDFSRNQLIRPNRNPIPLRRTLPVRMLERLCRRPALSLSAFLRLLRDKQASGPGSPKPPSNALRHELSELNRIIAEFDLPVVVERRGVGIRACIDRARLRTNIHQAKCLFAKARMSLAAADFGRTVRYAEQALEADYDFIAAVTLFGRIREVSDGYFERLRGCQGGDVHCPGNDPFRSRAATPESHPHRWRCGYR